MKKSFLIPGVFLFVCSIFAFYSCKTTSEAAIEDQVQITQEMEKVPAQDKEEKTVYNELDLTNSKKHKVLYRETLSSIAKKYYGDDKGYFFPLILDASKEYISNPEVIIPGMILIIPDLDKNITDPYRKEYVKNILLETSDLYKTKKTYFSNKISTELRKTAESL